MNHYRLEIEKTAAQAWKKNFGNLSEKSIQRLKDAGILDHKKELEGLKKGTENIVTKGGGIIDTTRRGKHLKRQSKQLTKAMDLSESMAILNDLEPNSLRAKLMGKAAEKFSGMGSGIMRKANRNFITIPPSADGVRGAIGVGDAARRPGLGGKLLMKAQGMDDPFSTFKYMPRKLEKDYANAIFARHEADEFRAAKKLIAKGDYEQIGRAKVPTSKRVFSHISPEVLHRESANVAIAPRNTKRFVEDVRTLSFEKDYLKQHGLDYGKSGVFDKKLSAKNVKNQGKVYKAMQQQMQQ